MARGIRVKSSVKDTDLGMRDLMRRLHKARKVAIDVGITGETGAAKKGTLTVLDVATFHEFGLGVPVRSFVRGWFDVYEKTAKAQTATMLKSLVLGHRSKEQVVNLLGVRWVAEMQKYISAGTNLQPLTRVTILRKGSSIPLIDTGQLRSSITYRVVVL